MKIKSPEQIHMQGLHRTLKKIGLRPKLQNDGYKIFIQSKTYEQKQGFDRLLGLARDHAHSKKRLPTTVNKALSEFLEKLHPFRGTLRHLQYDIFPAADDNSTIIHFKPRNNYAALTRRRNPTLEFLKRTALDRNSIPPLDETLALARNKAEDGRLSAAEAIELAHNAAAYDMSEAANILHDAAEKGILTRDNLRTFVDFADAAAFLGQSETVKLILDAGGKAHAFTPRHSKLFIKYADIFGRNNPSEARSFLGAGAQAGALTHRHLPIFLRYARDASKGQPDGLGGHAPSILLTAGSLQLKRGGKAGVDGAKKILKMLSAPRFRFRGEKRILADGIREYEAAHPKKK